VTESVTKDASLLIVGAGRLGRRVALSWPGKVTAETLSDRTHAWFSQRGIEVRQRNGVSDTFDCVLFCVPPSASALAYRDEAQRALGRWNRRGRFVFTSSTAVFAEAEGGEVREDSPTAEGERAERLLQVETEVSGAGGSVVRLAGLYDGESGPQLSYRRLVESPLRGDAWINLIHYDDAAGLVGKVLQSPLAPRIYLGCDDVPIKRETIAQLGPPPHCIFRGSDGPLGRKCNNTETRSALDWEPRWRSLADFVNAGAPRD